MFWLINEARTQPQAFLKKYEAKIKRYNSRYADYLRKAKPISKASWDKGLEAMARSAVEKGNLNPQYAGSNKLCGFPQGNMGGNIPTDAMSYVANFYTNVHNPDCQYFGCHFNKSTSKYSFAWGQSCNQQKMTYTASVPVDSSGVHFQKLNTAANVRYMNDMEKLMMQEINFVRAYPKVYAQIVASHLEAESKSIFGLDFDEKLAGEELIEELNQMKPVQILQPAECIYKAAKVHGTDCEKRGYFAHTGSDGSAPWDRITKHCPNFATGNENGAGNSDPSPRTAVISLLIDAGITSRGHRKNMLDAEWTHAACYYYKDRMSRWVQNFGHK
jgi:uncharacterized protein YkwD